MEVCCVLEVLDERPVEAIEDGEMGLVDFRAESCSSPKHLHPKNTGLDRAEEDNKLKTRDIHARTQHIDGDDNLWFRAISELSDSLKRSVDVRIASNLLNKPITFSELFPADSHKLVGM